MTNSAYGFMEGNRVSKNLRYVVPGTITPQIDKWEGLTGFKRRIGTETTEYSLKDNRIFWMWRLDHTTELLPSKNSEFKALMAAAGVLYYADYYVQNFFQRGGIRPALLQVTGVPTREEREKIENVWDKIIHGWSKYLGKVISANEMDVKVIGDGIDNVANGQLHSEKLADVAMAAGMPLSIILANSANYATAQTEYLVWFRDSVVPWTNYMQDELNDKLFKPLGLHFEFRPEMSDKGQEEERQRAGAYRAYVASGMKPSIAAQVVGIDLPPDIEYEELDDVFVPPQPQPVNETEIPIEKEELPKPVDEKSVTLLTIEQLRELEHWQDLAFRKLKQGKSLAFPWVSKTLPEEVASVIRDRLPACKSQADIERAFDLNMPDTPDHQLRELADALNKAVEIVVAEGKYSPDQPRVDAGHPDGGQWTDGSGGNNGNNVRLYNPLHPIDTDPETNAKLAEITESVRNNGWQGLPLLAWDDNLLNGCHRNAACRILGIEPEVYQLVIAESDDKEYREYLIENLRMAFDTQSVINALRDLYNEGLIDKFALEIMETEYEKE